jgi:hypothetical protein
MCGSTFDVTNGGERGGGGGGHRKKPGGFWVSTSFDVQLHLVLCMPLAIE